MTTSPRPQAPPGMRVGDYTLLTRVGEGGMGVVHLAQKSGGPRVALKVLRPHIVGDEEARARLAREVSSLSRIRSPRVAEIVDADPWGDIPYVATRYVPGLSLHDHTQQEGPIEGADLIWFAACLAEALAAVHSVGVLHRDVKPSNVLMEGRSPVLIDFGLARVADDPKLTHTGWLLGTPGYLAPEILYGEDATTAADVHSWAATVAYAGTGRSPFGRGPSMAIMDRVRRGQHDLEGVPGPLRGVLNAALDPKVGRRPTLEDLLDWLHRQAPAVRVRPTSVVVADDVFTQPLALAGATAADAPTTSLRDETPTAAYGSPTRMLPEEDDQDAWPTAWQPPVREPYRSPPPIQPVPPRPERRQGTRPDPFGEPEPHAAPQPTPLLERLRRFAVIMSGAGAAGAAVAVAPYLALVGILTVTWLLRSGSLSASAAGERRRLRGTKWYDAPQRLLATPWHLVASVPGTLLLALWSLGVAVAAGLICFAAAAGVQVTLGVCGFAFTIAIWCGPGGSRVRRPLLRVVHPIARRPLAWFVTTAALVAVAAGLMSFAASSGTDWTPAQGGPLAGTPLASVFSR